MEIILAIVMAACFVIAVLIQREQIKLRRAYARQLEAQTDLIAAYERLIDAQRDRIGLLEESDKYLREIRASQTRNILALEQALDLCERAKEKEPPDPAIREGIRIGPDYVKDWEITDCGWPTC